MKTLILLLLPITAIAAAIAPRYRIARCLTPERVASVVSNAPPDVRIQVPEFYVNTWASGRHYDIADVVTYSGAEYCCVQSHTVYDASWTPANVPALWRKLRKIGEDIPEWVQPTGAQDAYRKGEKVRYKNKIYQSIIDYNVFSPDAYPAGWKETT